jgi:hypothetical protein
MFLPTIVLIGGFSISYHEVDITQLKTCTFINKIKIIQPTYGFEDRIEINVDAHYKKGYGSCVFLDPITFYMQSNWIKEFFVIRFVKEEFQKFNYGPLDCKLLLYFLVPNITFVLKYGGQLHLVNQLLMWLHWKSDYTNYFVFS